MKLKSCSGVIIIKLRLNHSARKIIILGTDRRISESNMCGRYKGLDIRRHSPSIYKKNRDV